MKSVGMLAIVVAVLFVSLTAHATTWYVHPDSTLNSIQDGIDLCANSDTVLVGAGTYTENINFNGMAITVTSEYGADTTVIDGSSPADQDTGSVVLFISGEDTNSVLEGFTITGGSGTNDPVWGNLGGGVLCMNSSPVITSNIFHGNTAEWGGGIECIFDAHAIVRNNTFTSNVGDIQGGGISAEFSSSPLIIYNTINGNTAEFGGGIVMDSLSQAIVRKNIVTDNTANVYGGGISCYNHCSPTIDSCIITGNSVWGVHVGYSYPVINECNIHDNFGYEVYNYASGIVINAENNWWGHETGPYHPSNPGGLGGPVSNHVDFTPWRTTPGVEEQPSVKPVDENNHLGATIFRGSLHLPTGKKCKVFDITGRVVDDPQRIQPGIYFIEVDGVVTEKVVKVR